MVFSKKMPNFASETMAEAKGMTYEQLVKAVKAGQFSPVYLLMGEESYYIDRLCELIQQNAMSDADRDFNETIVFGNDVTDRLVADAARRYPMMAERQLVVLKEAQNLKTWDCIEKYVANGCMQTTILVICYKGTVDKRKTFYKAIQKSGVVFESVPLKEWQLPAFIENFVKGRKASIDEKSLMLIANAVGSDLNRLVGELEKLFVGMPDEGDRRITPDVVQNKIGVSKDFNSFELRDAIVTKNVFKANQIIRYFDKNPKAGSLYSFLPMMFRYFQNLMIAFYSPRRDAEGLVAALELRGQWAAKDYLTGMRNFTASKVMAIIGKMREIEAMSKGLDNVNTSEGELMKELVFFMLH